MVLPLLAILVSPFMAMAQVDDAYFVPTRKSEKSLVVESVAEKYSVKDVQKSAARNADEYNRRSGFTNDPEAYVEENFSDGFSSDSSYQDFDYSTRIVRFHSPRRALSPLYWDLAYDCGVNDWYVYDNGYSIDIYPTASNPLFYWSGPSYFWNSMNYYSWRNWHSFYGYMPFWEWEHYMHHYYDHWGYGRWYGSHWYNNHWYYAHHGGNWNYSRPMRHIPHNGAVTDRRDRGGKQIPSNSVSRGNGNNDVRGGGRNTGNVDLRGVRNGTGRDSNRAVADDRNSSTPQDNNGRVNLRGSSSGSGRSVGQAGQDNVNGRRDNGARRQQPARIGAGNTENRRSSAVGQGSSSVSRRSSSSGSYNRQSSTSVKRSSSSGSSRSSSSYRSSSRSSSGSSRSSGSSYRSSSGSSRSSAAGSSSSSRSSSGGSRSSGRSR